MTDVDTLELTPQAAMARLRAIRPADYASSCNHLDGAVTRLSPYLTHGVLSVAAVIRYLRTAYGLEQNHKLVFELGWREFYRYLWLREREAIERSLHAGPLPDREYVSAVPEDVLEARTGLAVIDRAVSTLYETGWLHNHARLWLASYLVHLRKVHWSAGAEWMLAYLVDGDLASNHLSWQWVAGTASRKPYLFNAENVRRFAPQAWHVDGTPLDIDYATLDAIAAGRAPWPHTAIPGRRTGVEPPALWPSPPGDSFSPARAHDIAGRDIWLVNPWTLADPPPGRIPVAVCDAHYHSRRPWSARRWRCVAARMSQVASIRWFDGAESIVEALRQARSVDGQWDPHLGRAFDGFSLRAAPRAFTDPDRDCHSFSAWWSRVRLNDIA